MSRSSRDEVSTTTGMRRVDGSALILPEHFEAVDARELQIQEHHSRQALGCAIAEGASSKKVVERFDSVTRDLDSLRRLVRGEGIHRQFQIVRVVLDNQNVSHAPPHPPRWPTA